MILILVNEIKSWKRELSYVGRSAITIQTFLFKTGHLLPGYCQHKHPTSITNPTSRSVSVSMYTFPCQSLYFRTGRGEEVWGQGEAGIKAGEWKEMEGLPASI